MKAAITTVSKRFQLVCFLFFLYLIPQTSFAQGVVVVAGVDTNTVRIGEQLTLKLQVTVPANYTVRFPELADSLDSFEIISKSEIDTVSNKDNSFTYRQQLQLTNFDSGFYVIQPLPFFFKDQKSSAFDSALTEALLVTVNTIPVDTTLAIKDIKTPVDVPLTFLEILPYLLVLLAAILIGYFIYRFVKSRKKVVQIIAPKIPTVPPHEIAMKALAELAEEKLWQQGFFKQYHTRVSDILRTYIEQRFSIRAMEETTDEILTQFRGALIIDDAKEKLAYVLRLADMVKFAKALPIGSENENSFSYAKDFILLTKPVTKEDFKEEEVTA